MSLANYDGSGLCFTAASLSVRLLVSFFQWYRRRYTHCDAVESAYTSNMADRHVEFPHGLE